LQKIASLFAALILCAGIASAEPAPDTSLDRDLQIARSLTEANRQATVAANMKLTDDESKAFWPLYREYRTEQAKQSDRLVELIKTYAKEYDTLTDDQAKELTRTYLDIDKKRLGLKEKYLKKFEKVLPAAKVARAMQAEQKLDAIQAFGIARTVPLIPAR
jgi:hypothetical protein